MTIKEEGANSSFYQLVIFRGPLGTGYNAVLLTGYGVGTDSRYRYKVLDDGSAVNISVSDTSFIISSKVGNALTSRIFLLLGKAPTISIS